MPPSLTEIRAAMADVIKQQTSAKVFTYSEVQNKGIFPAVIITPVAADFDDSMSRGTDEWFFELTVLVKLSGNDEGLAQRTLDKYVSGTGPDSIRQILHDCDELLPGVTVIPYGVVDYNGSYKWENNPHLGAKVKARVIIDNSA